MFFYWFTKNINYFRKFLEKRKKLALKQNKLEISMIKEILKKEKLKTTEDHVMQVEVKEKTEQTRIWLMNSINYVYINYFKIQNS